MLANKFAESLENARKSLGWTIEEEAARAGYGVDFLRRVHEGRPFPEVEKKLVQVLSSALAEKAARAVLSFHAQIHVECLAASFLKISARYELTLERVRGLSEEAAKIRLCAASNRSE